MRELRPQRLRSSSRFRSATQCGCIAVLRRKGRIDSLLVSADPVGLLPPAASPGAAAPGITRRPVAAVLRAKTDSAPNSMWSGDPLRRTVDRALVDEHDELIDGLNATFVT